MPWSALWTHSPDFPDFRVNQKTTIYYQERRSVERCPIGILNPGRFRNLIPLVYGGSGAVLSFMLNSGKSRPIKPARAGPRLVHRPGCDVSVR